MSSILQEFGKKISFYRKQRNLSQEKLAELANLHRTYIGQIENGKRNIALKNVEKLAQALEIPISELFKFDF